MQRSSQSIAALASALAKAQAELTNPEKSLVGTIKSGAGDTAERLFRYAPLSSGLDIVRKTLGQHEIATVQTTAIDQTAGIVNLTTVLAHASGEWIASDWPICAISDTATPHRMGAALTYARRYALFTLVGIAGEDDLDAPDLVTPTTQTSEPMKPKGQGSRWPNPNVPLDSNGQCERLQRGPLRRHDRNHSDAAKPPLGPEDSAELRERLLAEIADLDSGDAAALWAHRSLPNKNRLLAADAQRIEGTFQAKLATFATTGAEMPEVQPGKLENPPRSKKIDKGALALSEPRRVRDRDHVKYVAKQPCLICGRRSSDAHHLRFAQSRALGRKVSDEFTVPLCRGHHRKVHGCADETEWWKRTGIDPIVSARTLWLETHPLVSTSDKMGNEDASSAAVGDTDQISAKRDRPVSERDRNDKTKPINAAGQ